MNLNLYPHYFNTVNTVQNVLVVLSNRLSTTDILNIYQKLQNTSQKFIENCLLNFKEVWKNVHCSFVDNHVKDLSWRIVHNVLPVNDYLYSLHILQRNTPCYFCNANTENLLHLFYECVFVQPIWDKILNILNKLSGTSIQVDVSLIVYNNFTHSQFKDVTLYEMFLLFVNTTKYQIWKFRNTRKHERKKESQDVIFASIISCLKLRCHVDFYRLSLNDFKRYWCRNSTLATCTDEHNFVFLL